MSIISEVVNERFGNSGGTNPFFKTIVEILEQGGLYNSNLIASPKEQLALTPEHRNGVYSFKDLNGKTQVVAIDVLIDAISRGIMKKLQDGSGINNITCDSASNLSYKSGPELDQLSSVSGITASTNINEAISVLAQEIGKIKSALGILAPVGIPLTLPNKKLRLDAIRDIT